MTGIKNQRVNDVEEKRKHPRLRMAFPLFCRYLTSKVSFFSTFKDIGSGGMCLEDNRFLSLKEQMEFKIEFRDRIINCKGKIVWQKYFPESKDKKAGVKFTYLESGDRDYIADMVANMKSI